MGVCIWGVRDRHRVRDSDRVMGRNRLGVRVRDRLWDRVGLGVWLGIALGIGLG